MTSACIWISARDGNERSAGIFFVQISFRFTQQGNKGWNRADVMIFDIRHYILVIPSNRGVDLNCSCERAAVTIGIKVWIFGWGIIES